MPNVWKWKAVDGAGKPVDAAPGSSTFQCRGPSNKKEMIEAATLLLDNKRREAIREGLADPGYRVVESSVEPVGDANDDLLGDWKPQGAAPINLPTDPAVNAARESRLADEGQ